MTIPGIDHRSPGRRARDEQIAAEPPLPPLELPPDAAPSAVLSVQRVVRQKGDSMKYYALFYSVVDDFVSRRAAYREEHLRLAREAHGRGELLLGGALTDPADRALLVFRTPQRSVVEEFARHDPYVIHGLVTHWEVRPWAVVIGNKPSSEGSVT